MAQYDNVSVVKAANVYFDGKCVSHTVQFADGTKKTVGVILPSSLTFNTGAPEIMEANNFQTRTLKSSFERRIESKKLDWKHHSVDVARQFSQYLNCN